MDSQISLNDVPGYVVPVLIIGVSVYLVYRREMARCPGPRGLPLIGNIPQVAGGRFDEKLQNFKRRYGDIFRLKLGEMTTVFIFGLKNIEEVLLRNGDNFSDRPNWLYIPDKIIQKKGLIWTNGEIWQRMRDIVTNTQISPSCGRHTETEILAEVNHVVEVLSSRTESAQNDLGLDPSDLFGTSVFNILSSFVFGQRFDEKEEDFSFLKNGFKDLTERNKTQNPANMFPSLGKCMPSKRDQAILKEQEVFTVMKRHLDAHSRMSVSDNPRDLMDIYNENTSEETSEETSDKETLENNFLRSIVDIYMYGSEMTTSLLLWTVAYLVRYPEVQLKCQEEIDKVVKDRNVTSSDRTNLPYCVATLREVLRLSSPGIMTAVHCNKKSAVIHGHMVPERSLVVCDLREPRLSDSIWENPDDFQPERFLKTLDETQERVASLSFGLGVRCCPGRKLTELAHFLYSINLLRHFKISHDEESIPISLSSEYKGVSLKPQPYKVVFRKRETSNGVA